MDGEREDEVEQSERRARGDGVQAVERSYLPVTGGLLSIQVEICFQ